MVPTVHDRQLTQYSTIWVIVTTTVTKTEIHYLTSKSLKLDPVLEKLQCITQFSDISSHTQYPLLEKTSDSTEKYLCNINTQFEREIQVFPRQLFIYPGNNSGEKKHLDCEQSLDKDLRLHGYQMTQNAIWVFWIRQGLMESRNTDPSQFHDETHGPCIYSESTSLAIKSMFCDQWNLKIHFLTCEIRGIIVGSLMGCPLVCFLIPSKNRNSEATVQPQRNCPVQCHHERFKGLWREELATSYPYLICLCGPSKQKSIMTDYDAINKQMILHSQFFCWIQYLYQKI